MVYFLDYPRSFLHSTSGGWQQFCLDAPEDLCVSIQAHEDYAGDEAALADEVITGFSAAVSDYQELHRQSARTASGLPAVFVSYTYTRGEQEIEGARLFVTAQGVGFDIAVEGEPVMVEVYRSIMKGVQESLRILERGRTYHEDTKILRVLVSSWFILLWNWKTRFNVILIRTPPGLGVDSPIKRTK